MNTQNISIHVENYSIKFYLALLLISILHIATIICLLCIDYEKKTISINNIKIPTSGPKLPLARIVYFALMSIIIFMIILTICALTHIKLYSYLYQYTIFKITLLITICIIIIVTPFIIRALNLSWIDSDTLDTLRFNLIMLIPAILIFALLCMKTDSNLIIYDTEQIHEVNHTINTIILVEINTDHHIKYVCVAQNTKELQDKINALHKNQTPYILLNYQRPNLEAITFNGQESYSSRTQTDEEHQNINIILKNYLNFILLKFTKQIT